MILGFFCRDGAEELARNYGVPTQLTVFEARRGFDGSIRITSVRRAIAAATHAIARRDTRRRRVCLGHNAASRRCTVNHPCTRRSTIQARDNAGLCSRSSRRLCNTSNKLDRDTPRPPPNLCSRPESHSRDDIRRRCRFAARTPDNPRRTNIRCTDEAHDPTGWGLLTSSKRKGTVPCENVRSLRGYIEADAGGKPQQRVTWASVVLTTNPKVRRHCHALGTRAVFVAQLILDAALHVFPGRFSDVSPQEGERRAAT